MSERNHYKPTVPIEFLLLAGTESNMKPDDSKLIFLKIEDKQKFEDATTYVYAGSDPSAVFKPITVYKEKNASAYVVAGRYAGVTDTHLKYKPLSESEQKIVVEKLGSGKIVKFLTSGKD
ncbi:MAG: hypothetical protein ABSD41_11510 [Candidatus Bathyarchaeia archaeon]|jgi:hypothetical protein